MDITKLPESFYNRKRIIVMGNSGSLLDTPKQNEWVDNPLVIGVNRQLREGLDRRKYIPDILVVSDRRVLYTDGSLIESASDKVHLCMPPWLIMRYHPVVRPYYIFDATTAGTQNNSINRTAIINDLSLPIVLGDKLVSICNVSFHAIQLAYLLNPDEICIMGIECAWPMNNRPHHFYDTDKIIHGDFKPRQVTNQFDFMWKKIQSYITMPIYDLSPWGDISRLSFKRKDVNILL